MGTFAASGIGQTIVQVVAENGDNTRAYVVDEDGSILPTQEFWAKERAAREAQFGKMMPSLFEQQAALAPSDTIEADVFVYADVPEPQLPYDGTDTPVAIEAFEQWTREHADAQVPRIAAAKARVLSLLADNGAVVTASPRGLPTIRARMPVELLRSAQLNAPDVARIDPVVPQTPALLGYAARAAMGASPSSGGLSGGICGGPCYGGGIDVGLWEGIETPSDASGMARNNIRISTGNVVTGYEYCPKTCNTDADCPDVELLGSAPIHRSCQPPVQNGQKVCVQDHLTWVAASLGMSGSYSYGTNVPLSSDPAPNVPAGTTFGSTGAWDADVRVGNNSKQAGLDFLITTGPASPSEPCQQPSAPPTTYVNRSQALTSETRDVVNWPGRAFGTFVTAAAGNDGAAPVACAALKNGLCVGMLDYRTFDDQATHVRTARSSYIDDASFDSTLERPHLLGPGNHSGVPSGLHMPSIDVAPPSSQMRHASYDAGFPVPGIVGTSFAAPMVLSAAIQAHEYEGWFSALAFPMVNKAVLLASTRDANNDGPIGKASAWSQNAPTVDAEDGAGQINFGSLQDILANNRYYWRNLADGDFVSCGTGCREHVVATVGLPASSTIRVAMAWQSCMIAEGSLPTLNNDLDLVVACGSSFTGCGSSVSNTVTSELEMAERYCTRQSSCSIRIRIKNGATLAACGSTTTERTGVAWSIRTTGMAGG